MCDWWAGVLSVDASGMLPDTLTRVDGLTGEVVHSKELPIDMEPDGRRRGGRERPSSDPVLRFGRWEHIAQSRRWWYEWPAVVCGDELPSPPRVCLSVSGNISKFAQGHNLFGPRLSLRGPLLRHIVRTLARAGSLAVDWSDRVVRADEWRVDEAVSIRFDRQAEARDWLSMAAACCRSRRGAGLAKGFTVYFGLGSTYWHLKCYSKFDELVSARKKLADWEGYQHACDWAEGIVRIEVTLRRPELLRLPGLGPRDGVVWDYWDRLVKSAHSGASLLNGVAALPVRLQGAVALWQAGRDLRAGADAVPHNTFYRWRRAIKEATGLDISVPYEAKQESPVVDGGEQLSEAWLAARQDTSTAATGAASHVLGAVASGCLSGPGPIGVVFAPGVYGPPGRAAEEVQS